MLQLHQLASITDLIVEFVYLTANFELNLTRSRLRLRLRASGIQAFDFRGWHGERFKFQHFLF